MRWITRGYGVLLHFYRPAFRPGIGLLLFRSSLKAAFTGTVEFPLGFLTIVSSQVSLLL